MDKCVYTDPGKSINNIEALLLRFVVFLLFALKLFEFAVQDIRSNQLFAAPKNPPTASRLHQRDTGLRARSCNSRRCHRASK